MVIEPRRRPVYKDVSASSILAIDIETYDPHLAKEEGGLGPGVYRNDGYILGVSIADDSGFSEYYNLGHITCDRLDRQKNIEYLRKVLALPMPKLGANISYDVDWLENWKGDPSKGYRWEAPCFKVNGLLYDIQIAEYLLDENQSQYHLDFLANKYLGVGKYKNDIDAYRDEHNKFADAKYQWKGDIRRWLFKIPYETVAKYAIEDVREPLQIFEMQKKLLEEQRLWDTFILETELLRATLSMRTEGALVDTHKRDVSAYKAGCERERRMMHIEKEYGKINLNSTQQLAALFDSLNIAYPYKLRYKDAKGNEKEEQVSYEVAKEILDFMKVWDTPPQSLLDATYNNFSEIITCNPSITKEWFESMEKQLDDDSDMHGLVKDILYIRKADKIVNDFLMGSMKANICPDGRIHPSIHTTRNDEYGTRSGRFSMSNPNLQQIPSPSRDKLWGGMCREPFIPKPNCWWVKIDYSQIEYRCLAHYASGLGSMELVEAYNNDPHTDYHQYVMDMTGLTRSYAKNLNFGCMYGMGKKKMSRFFGWGDKYADEVLNIYHGNAPYVKHTMNTVSQVAKARGYIKTLSGRRAHLVNKDKAYIMVNRLIQGSAADIMKKAMVDVYKSGVLDTIAWHLTVHDELDMSVPKTAKGIREVFRVKHIMEDAFKLKVPVKAEMEIGDNWANVSELDFTDLEITEDEWLEKLTDENVEQEVATIVARCAQIRSEKKAKATK